VGTDESGIVTFGGQNVDEVLISSVVAVDKAQTLYGGSTKIKFGAGTAIRYLKMRLAGLNYDEPHSNGGIDLNDPISCRAMASWYLARVICNSQEWILKQEESRAKGRPIQWSANVGVPVEHYDSAVINVFRVVLGLRGSGRLGEKSLNDYLTLSLTIRKLRTALTRKHLTAMLFPRLLQQYNLLLFRVTLNLECMFILILVEGQSMVFSLNS
jgi:hypothetical protein